MNYLWQEFNIKTFISETIVFRDGVFIPELSTLEFADINKTYDRPIHIIYVGEISGDKTLDINISAPNQSIFMTLKLKNKTPADLKINVKNTGKNSEFKGNFIIENFSEINLENNGHHLNSDTTIIMKTKIIATKNSISKLSGAAHIDKNYTNCTSDIGFSALADKESKITFSPNQFISSEPLGAEHSASLYKPLKPQIQFLEESGLDKAKALGVLSQAFLDDNDLF